MDRVQASGRQRRLSIHFWQRQGREQEVRGEV